MQDIILLGAEYEDVPAVNLPAVGGGTAKFTDTTPVTAEDGDVAAGKIYVKSNGELSTGTASGGSAVIEALNVTANGTYTAPTGVDGYSPVTVNVSGGGGAVASKEVNFIDYDGTVLHAYTVAEFQQLSVMPSNPSHTGLTAQGWNWSLTDAKAQLTAMPDAGLTIGQMYVTSDGKTRIYVHFEEGRTSPYLGICPKGTVTIDWGDGSATETLTGTSLSTVKTIQHNYQPGDYVIELSVSGTDTFAITGSSYGTRLLRKVTTDQSNGTNRVYAASIRKIEVGTGASLGANALMYCANLTAITIPQTMTFSNYAFCSCNSLKAVVIPSAMTNSATYTFYQSRALERVSIPKGMTTIGSNLFYQCEALISITLPSGVTSNIIAWFYMCYALSNLTVPAGITTIYKNSFGLCAGLASVRLMRTTAPTISDSNAWASVPTDCLLLVPYAGLASYLSASNYPSKTSYTYLGYATYASGATLPTKDSTNAYNVTWYATKEDAKAGTNAISAGNGSEIYCTYAAV